MRDLLEQSRSARVAVVVVAGCCILALVQAAAAHNDLDMREVFRMPAPTTGSGPAPQPAGRVAASAHSSAARPLRITLRRATDLKPRVAVVRLRTTRHVADRRAPVAVPMAVMPPPRDELFEPLQQGPAIVSIYQDQTLRRGDAVMMIDGLHVFSGREAGTHRATDFVQLAHALSLDWHLRKTLSAFENNPPDHWRS